MKVGAVAAVKPPAKRLIIAVPLFLVALACPFVATAILTSDLPIGTKAWAGFLFFPIPEAFDLTAIAILGKPGFVWLKSLLSGVFRRQGPLREVSRFRYRIGLAMFLSPLLLGWLHPYLGERTPAVFGQPALLHMAGDLIFISSFFVLGGDFWDKVRALFIYRAKAHFPDDEKHSEPVAES